MCDRHARGHRTFPVNDITCGSGYQWTGNGTVPHLHSFQLIVMRHVHVYVTYLVGDNEVT